MKIKQAWRFLFKLKGRNNNQWKWHWLCVSINPQKTNIPKILAKGLAWIPDSKIDHAISISKYNPLAGSSYI